MTRRCDCGSTQFRQMKYYSKEIIHSTSTGHQAEGSLEVTDGEIWTCLKCGKGYDNISDVPVGEDCLHEDFKVEYKIKAVMSMECDFAMPFSQGSKELVWKRGGGNWMLREYWTSAGETCVMKIVCNDCGAIIFDREKGFKDTQAWFDISDLVDVLEDQEFWEIPSVKNKARILYDHDHEKWEKGEEIY